MKDILSSLETEYAFVALDHEGERLKPRWVHKLFYLALQNQQPWLHAAEGGWFLGNGARVYWDVGAHPEYAAPECSGHPRDLVAHVRAGHAILSRIAREMEQDHRVAEVRIWRGNIDYLSKVSWGCHESYLTQHSARRLARDLIPHLVSRIVYGGAGGFSPHDCKRFSLSPRLELFHMTESLGTMSERGIINTRDEPHARAHRRLHLICRDSVTSQFVDLLSIGMTRLVVALADVNLRPAGKLTLDNAVAALHAFCLDTSCKARVETSLGPMTAIDIQRRYIEEIDAHADDLPSWTHEILKLCTDVLDRLADDPRSLCGKLEWPTKLAIFESEPRRGQRELLMQDVLLSDLHQPLLGELYQRRGGEIVSAAEINDAIANAPATTRARIRGQVVKKFSGREDVYCNWADVHTPDQRLVMDEPFETRECWRTMG